MAYYFISSCHRNCLSFDLCRPCLAWCPLTTTGVTDSRQPAEPKTCDLDSQIKTRVHCLCSAPRFVPFIDSVQFHDLTAVLTLARAPLSNSPFCLFRLCGQPASSPPPLNEVIDALPLPRAGTQPATSTTPPTATVDISTIYCSHGFSTLTPIIPLSVFFPPISLYAPIHPSRYPGVVFYFVIGYRKYSPGCSKCASTAVTAL